MADVTQLTYQNGGKYTMLPLNYQMAIHKIYQMAIKYTYQHFLFQGPEKYAQTWILVQEYTIWQP
jgi:hypothetical protein